MASKDNLFGRTVIYSAEEEITRENLLTVLSDAIDIHEGNQEEIEYLYNYYKGKQPILERQNTVRPEIQNNIVENRANEIVSFKVGYLMGEPVQYINRGEDELSASLNLLNEYMYSENKAAKDKELADWFTICGTSYRMVLPDATYNLEEDEAPFEIYTLDPRNAFVVYHSGVDHRPLMGVNVIPTAEDAVIYAGYTATHYFEVSDDTILKWEPHTIGMIPIIEYPANMARLGAFEIVLPLLDAINTVESNCVDGLEGMVQSLLVFKGVDITNEQFAALRQLGGITVPPDGDVHFISVNVNQGDTQTLVNRLYQSVLTICGMPNRNGGMSTSDTGTAVIYRDGFFAAEARAKDSELYFKQSEMEFLKAVIRICDAKARMELKLSSIEIRFTRRNYENITEKANVLVTMLNNGMIHPKLAFEHSGMFVDPEIAYKMSMEYAEQAKNEAANALNELNVQAAEEEKAAINASSGEEVTEDVRTDGQGDTAAE